MLPKAAHLVWLVLPLLVLVVSVECVVKSVTINTELPLQDGTPMLLYHDGVIDGWQGRVNYSDQTFQNGWAYLEVETRGSGELAGVALGDAEAAYIAGHMEGALTHEIIYNSWRNTMEGFCTWKGEQFCKNLRAFLSSNRAWMRTMIAQHSAGDPLWYQVSLVLRQLDGLVAGYKSASLQHINDEDIYWMNLQGDLEDLSSVLAPGGGVPSLRGGGHCSALIKLLPGNTDLYTAHVTWNSFQSMLRLQKKYILPFQQVELTRGVESVVPGHTVTMSSYPGIIHSADDFYLLSSGLLSQETTIGNSNSDLWHLVKPVGQIQEWIRVLVANRLAVDGRSWAKLFSKYNSGTYNNQWMIVDYKLFTPQQMLKPNTLWILEQIPGLIVSGDQTHRVQETGYWPSYNVPYYEEVFNTSGLPALVEQYGDWFSYDNTARALIFARDQGKVKDLGSMIKLMRYNDFKNDPLSKCDCIPPFSGENAISARNDLNPENGTYPFSALGHRSHAGTDVKVTTSQMFKEYEFLAINGPTYDQQPVFRWSTSDFANNTAHFGHPDVWKFPVVQQTWVW